MLILYLRRTYNSIQFTVHVRLLQRLQIDIVQKWQRNGVTAKTGPRRWIMFCWWHIAGFALWIFIGAAPCWWWGWRWWRRGGSLQILVNESKFCCIFRLKCSAYCLKRICRYNSIRIGILTSLPQWRYVFEGWPTAPYGVHLMCSVSDPTNRRFPMDSSWVAEDLKLGACSHRNFQCCYPRKCYSVWPLEMGFDQQTVSHRYHVASIYYIRHRSSCLTLSWVWSGLDLSNNTGCTFTTCLTIASPPWLRLRLAAHNSASFARIICVRFFRQLHRFSFVSPISRLSQTK